MASDKVRKISRDIIISEGPITKDIKAIGKILGMKVPDITSNTKSMSKSDIDNLKKISDAIKVKSKSKSGIYPTKKTRCEMKNGKWINGECIPKSEIRKGRKKGTNYPDRK